MREKFGTFLQKIGFNNIKVSRISKWGSSFNWYKSSLDSSWASSFIFVKMRQPFQIINNEIYHFQWTLYSQILHRVHSSFQFSLLLQSHMLSGLDCCSSLAFNEESMRDLWHLSLFINRYLLVDLYYRESTGRTIFFFQKELMHLFLRFLFQLSWTKEFKTVIDLTPS